MAAKQFSFFVLLIISCIIFSSSHARESRYFNKNPATTSNAVLQAENKPETSPQPEFLPDNEPAHGLYAPTTNNNNNLPSNYNPVSYVTPMIGAENESPARVVNNNNNNYLPNNEQSNYFVTPEEQDPEFVDTRLNNNNNNNYDYVKAAAALGSRESNTNNNNNNNYYLPQGMSDTRSMENGKYHYDIESERFSSNEHPSYYESFTRTNPAYDAYEINNNNNNNGGGQKSTMGRGGYNNQGGQRSTNGGGGVYNNQEQQQQYDEFLNNWHP